MQESGGLCDVLTVREVVWGGGKRTPLASLAVVARKAPAPARAAVAQARVAALCGGMRRVGARWHIHPGQIRGTGARRAVGGLVKRNVRGGAPAIVANAAAGGRVASAMAVARVEVAAAATPGGGDEDEKGEECGAPHCKAKKVWQERRAARVFVF